MCSFLLTSEWASLPLRHCFPFFARVCPFRHEGDLCSFDPDPQGLVLGDFFRPGPGLLPLYAKARYRDFNGSRTDEVFSETTPLARWLRAPARVTYGFLAFPRCLQLRSTRGSPMARRPFNKTGVDVSPLDFNPTPFYMGFFPVLGPGRRENRAALGAVLFVMGWRTRPPVRPWVRFCRVLF